MDVAVQEELQQGRRPMPGEDALNDGRSVLRYIGGMQQIDDRGEFRIARLEAGKYYLRVSGMAGDPWAPSYRATYYGGTLDANAAKPISIEPGQDARADIEVVSVQGVRVSGRAHFSGGEAPVPNARALTNAMLTKLDADGRQSWDAMSGNASAAADEFEIRSVLPGKYRLVVMRYLIADLDRYTGNPTLVSVGSRLVEVGATDVVGLDLDLEPPGEIPGTVEFVEGCRRVPMQIRVFGSAGGLGMPTPMLVDAPDGKFVLKGVAPGTAHLDVSAATAGDAVYSQGIKIGERAVEGWGFETPVPSGERLTIQVGCPQQIRSSQ